MTMIKHTLVFLLGISILMFAHGGKKHKKEHHVVKKDTITVVNGDTIAINGVPVSANHEDDHVNENTKIESYSENDHVHGENEKEEIGFDSLFEHMHNKLIHFPIALGILLFIFMVIGYKQEVCHRASKIIVIVGLLFSIASVITGFLQKGPFEGTELIKYVTYHQYIGIAITITYLITSWAIFTRQSNKIQLALTFLLALLISAAGFLGGIIAH